MKYNAFKTFLLSLLPKKKEFVKSRKITPSMDEYLEKTDGVLSTYLRFHGNTTGMIRVVYKLGDLTISQAKSFRVAFEGEYTDIFPMLGTAEFLCRKGIEIMRDKYGR